MEKIKLLDGLIRRHTLEGSRKRTDSYAAPFYWARYQVTFWSTAQVKLESPKVGPRARRGDHETRSARSAGGQFGEVSEKIIAFTQILVYILSGKLCSKPALH